MVRETNRRANFHLKKNFIFLMNTSTNLNRPRTLGIVILFSSYQARSLFTENLEQGRRRLKKAHYTLNCETTDTETERSFNKSNNFVKSKAVSKAKLDEVLSTRIEMPSRNQTPDIGTRPKPKKTFTRVRQLASDSGSDDYDDVRNFKRMRTSNSLDNSKIPELLTEFESSRGGTSSRSDQLSLTRNVNLSRAPAISDSEEDNFHRGLSPEALSPTKSIDSSQKINDELDLTPPPSFLNIDSSNRKRPAFTTNNDGKVFSSICSPKETPKSARFRTTLSLNEQETLRPRNNRSSNRHADSEICSIVNPTLEKYIEEKMDRKLENLRRRICYDMRMSVNELKTTMIGMNLPQAAGPNMMEIRARLSTSLPFESDQEFTKYDATLTMDADLINTLRTFMKVLIATKTDEKSCVTTIMAAIMKKTVALEYSGYGKECKGKKQKKSFKETGVCQILIDVIREILGAQSTEKKIMSEISTWLSGAGDREGGRKARSTGSKRRSRSA